MNLSRMDRRRALAVLGTIGIGGVAGCLGEDGIQGVAKPAVIPDAAAHGYDEDGPEEIKFDETIEVGGIEQDVNIRTYSAAYASSDDESMLFLFSTPDISVAGFSVNPLARLSGADLIARVIDEGLGAADTDGGIRDIESEDEREVTVLGDERAVQVFSAVFEAEGAEQAGEDGEIPIKLYVLSVTHQEDVILSVGFHPETVDASDNILSLMEHIEHPAE